MAWNNVTRSGATRRLDGEIGMLAFPALGALAADPLVSLVDTAFVGRLGTLPLAALGINTAIFTLAFVVFNFLAYATTPRIAHALGTGDRKQAGAIAVHALVLALMVGVGATVLLILLGPSVLRLMGASDDLFAPSLAYLRIRALAGPAVLLIMAGHGIFRGYQDTATPMRLTLMLNGVNLVLDPILIFWAGWGLEGAGWATVVAQWLGAAGFLYLFTGPRRDLLGDQPTFPRPRHLLPFLRIGVALLFRTLALIGTLTLATAVATRLGSAAVAGHQVAMQLWLLLALVIDALAVAAQALVGRYRGAGDSASLRRLTDRLLLWGLGAGALLTLILAGVSPWLPRIFTDDAASLAQVGAVMAFVVWMQPLNALVFVGDGIFMGLQSFRFLAVQMLLSAAAAGTVLALVVPMGWGLPGVWWGLVALMIARAVTLAWGYGHLVRPRRARDPGREISGPR